MISKVDHPRSFSFVPSICQLWKYVKPYKTTLLGGLLAILASATTTLVLGQGLRLFIDHGFSKDQTNLLHGALGFMVITVFIMALASFFRYYCVSWLGERITADLRKSLFQRLLSLDLAFYEKEKVGDLLSRVNTDTSMVQTLVATSVPIILRNGLIFLGGGTLLVMTSAKLTSIVLIFIPVVLVLVLIFGRFVRRLSKSSQDKLAEAGGYLEESLNFIATIKTYAREHFTRQHFDGFVEETFETAAKRIRARASLSATVIFSVFSVIAIMLWIGANDVLAGTLSGGELGSFVFYAVVVAGSVAAISDVLGDLSRAAGSVDRVMELMAETPTIQQPDSPEPLPKAIKGGLIFDSITFTYPSKPDQTALKDLSLDIKAGEKIALVGASGAGKSTLFKLLLRLYDIQKGSIKIEGLNIQDLRFEDLRGLFSVVPQDPVVFATSALENIRYGRPTATNAEVKSAAKAAQADIFIQELPEGYETFLGEKGVRLSGGQKQRIAIARAILKDPKILLLDEATSALDSENEALVQQGLATLMKNRTSIVIAHRLSTISSLDRIIVLEDGQVVESGSHTNLLKNNGPYAALWALQSGKKVA